LVLGGPNQKKKSDLQIGRRKEGVHTPCIINHMSHKSDMLPYRISLVSSLAIIL